MTSNNLGNNLNEAVDMQEESENLRRYFSFLPPAAFAGTCPILSIVVEIVRLCD